MPSVEMDKKIEDEIAVMVSQLRVNGKNFKIDKGVV